MLDGLYIEVLVAQYLFLGLLPVVTFAPLRWAVLAWLIMGNLDTTGGSAIVSSAIGWMNAAKGILLPALLWWRLRSTPGEVLIGMPGRLWIALAGYAAVASLWSPFPLAAAKMVGNMIGILLSFVVLERAARRGLVNGWSLVVLIATSLGLGLFQTLAFNAYGYDGPGRPGRFTSFVTAQQYAAFLVAFLAVALWYPGIRIAIRIALILGITAGLVMNGSRTWFLGAVIIVTLYLWRSNSQRFAYSIIALAAVLFTGLLIANFDPNGPDWRYPDSGRIGATITALVTGEDTPERTGLANLNFRLTVYQGALEEISTAGVSDVLLGHGTSSGGNVVMRVFPAAYKPDTLDPNRVLHNEWLRSLYEWGIGGFLLVIATMLSMVIGLAKRVQIKQSHIGSVIALSFAPAFVLAFSTENLIAGAGNAVTMSLALLVSLSWAHPISFGGTVRPRYAAGTTH